MRDDLGAPVDCVERDDGSFRVLAECPQKGELGRLFGDAHIESCGRSEVGMRSTQYRLEMV